MAYYIFLKSLRSLEEFRKNPHVKIPPKSPTNFQSLDKFKNPILIQKFFFLISVRPTPRPTRPLSLASPLATPSPVGRKRPADPSSPCVGHVFVGSTFSFSDHAFPSRLLSPSVTATRALPVSFVISPAPADPGWNFSQLRRPAPRMPPSFYSSSSSLPLLNPLQTKC
jgi:hypothetical protein